MNDTIISVEKLSKKYRLGQIGATTMRESVERWLAGIRNAKRDHRPQTADCRLGEGEYLTPVPPGTRAPETAEESKKEAAQSLSERQIQAARLPSQGRDASDPSGSDSNGDLMSPPDGGGDESPSSLRTRALEHGNAGVKKSSGVASSDDADLWALRDVSFEVKRGEVLGIIGRNGAGKSTLLKILSRITEPTSGRAIMRGRVASLLEVGTGFHPELTGRENIYLNGAILGMRHREITAKFDEIVAFSEVERFIDTPVKRYSSGMYVRLAFAVAAHLDPEILLVDEVLAVGDAAFQKKCLGKMNDVAKHGRTVLFVSHNMAAISTLCPKSLLIVSGRLQASGYTPDILEQYLTKIDYSEEGSCGSGDDIAEFISARICDKDGVTVKGVSIGNPFVVEMVYRVKRDQKGAVVPNFHFYTDTGVCCFVSNAPSLADSKAGVYKAQCFVPGYIMNEGTFSIGVAATTYPGTALIVNFWEKGLLTINIRDPKIPDEHNYGFVHTVPGVLRPRFNWSVEKE